MANDKNEDQKEETKIESLDDLFDDVEEPETKKVEEAPMLTQDEEDNKKEDDVLSYDVQKELEAKFDELFGALEDDDN